MMPTETSPPVLSGLADEAGSGIETQVRAHLELGWRAIELRQIDGRNVSLELPRADFDRVCEVIAAAGLTVSGVASAIGNWSRPITGEFQLDVAELKSAVGRLARLGTRCLRTMSWTRDGATESAWRHEAVRRYRELARIAADADVLLLHENCEGWGGQSARHTAELIAEVASPHVGVLFDTGNTISHGCEPWEYYVGVKPLIRYVHVKDCRRNPRGGRSADYVPAGAGDAQVREILGDLLASGYRGVVSIEPHVAAVLHRQQEADPETRYRAYLDYGRGVNRLVAELLETRAATR